MSEVTDNQYVGRGGRIVYLNKGKKILSTNVNNS
jgi:hypothetical protein